MELNCMNSVSTNLQTYDKLEFTQNSTFLGLKSFSMTYHLLL